MSHYSTTLLRYQIAWLQSKFTLFFFSNLISKFFIGKYLLSGENIYYYVPGNGLGASSEMFSAPAFLAFHTPALFSQNSWLLYDDAKESLLCYSYCKNESTKA